MRTAVAVCRTVYCFLKRSSLGQEHASRKPRRGDLCFQRFGHFLRNTAAGRKGLVEESGIQVDWVNCSPADEARGSKVPCRQAAFPQHLHLRIVRRSLNLKDSILGISYLSSDGAGCQADIFYEEIEKLRHETFVDAAIILGHVAAHEIGHLLLGSNSHSSWGIMRAHWNMEELARANKGLLFFTKSQSHRMSEKLCAAIVRNKWPSATSAELSAEG